MSRQLPSYPNLEHLRKHAKDLLRHVQAQHPGWQLADAQHALARDYGFASWPALKAHVDALPPDSRPPVARSKTSPPDAAVMTASPLVGLWVANLELSERHPAFLFQRATLDLRVAGDRITFTQVVVDPAGRESASTMTIVADGEARQGEGGHGHRLVARWLDIRTLEVLDQKDGQVVGRGSYAVSEDARRLTVTASEQCLVFDRG